MKEVYCRICWNTANWQHPTGEAAKLEKNSFISKSGFGMEEWLFNFGWMFNGFHYGSLQPIDRSYKKYENQKVNILLYSISNAGRFFIGKIDNCSVVSENEAKSVYNYYKSQRWLNEMLSDLKRLNINDKFKNEIKKPRKYHGLFNIKFRRDDFSLFDPFIEIPTNHTLNTIPRYTAMELNTLFKYPSIKKNIQKNKTFKKKSETTRYRRAISGLEFDPSHDRLQNIFYNYLENKYGAKNLAYENEFVDITLKNKSEIIFFEVKTEPNVKRCIRSALGQLIEYSCYPDNYKANKLIIIGEHNGSDKDKKYLDYLRNKFKIPIYYNYFDPDVNRVIQEI